MTRYRWLFVILILLGGVNVSHAADDPFASWCIPAIQRHPPVQAACEPTIPVAQNEEPHGILDVSLEETADRLYREAVELDDHGESVRASEKLVTILEQCPTYPKHDMVVQRLNDMVMNWRIEATAKKQDWREKRRTILNPNRTSEQRRELEARATQTLEAIHQSTLRKIIDADAFLWDRRLHEFPDGWDWIEDLVLLEDDAYYSPPPFVDGQAVGIWNSPSEITEPIPTFPSHRWFSSPWKQQIMMLLQLDRPPMDRIF